MNHKTQRWSWLILIMLTLVAVVETLIGVNLLIIMHCTTRPLWAECLEEITEIVVLTMINHQPHHHTQTTKTVLIELFLIITSKILI